MFNKRSLANGSVLTMGNFDGVHLGHQAMLAELIRVAKLKNLPAVVIIFEPQPIEFFCRDNAPARLMTLRQKIETLKEAGIDGVYCLKFNKTLASLTPRLFIQSILIERLKAHYILVGNDFKFGYNRSGDFKTLQSLESEFNFKTQAFDLVERGNHKVSSTRIRKALSNDDLALAKLMLSRDYQVSGRVIHGAKRGRLIGVPTANIRIKHLPLALSGVFSVQVTIDSQVYNAVANIGFRPTVKGVLPQLEVHLFNFTGDLYSKRIRVSFKHKVRNEVKFESFEALTTQIKKDIETAKQQLSKMHDHL